MSASPPCLDCGKPLIVAPFSDQYPKGTAFSSCYLCPFCRTHRYASEAAALARCRAGLDRQRSQAELKKASDAA